MSSQNKETMRLPPEAHSSPRISRVGMSLRGLQRAESLQFLNELSGHNLNKPLRLNALLHEDSSRFDALVSEVSDVSESRRKAIHFENENVLSKGHIKTMEKVNEQNSSRYEPRLESKVVASFDAFDASQKISELNATVCQKSIFFSWLDGEDTQSLPNMVLSKAFVQMDPLDGDISINDLQNETASIYDEKDSLSTLSPIIPMASIIAQPLPIVNLEKITSTEAISMVAPVKNVKPLEVTKDAFAAGTPATVSDSEKAPRQSVCPISGSIGSGVCPMGMDKRTSSNNNQVVEEGPFVARPLGINYSWLGELDSLLEDRNKRNETSCLVKTMPNLMKHMEFTPSDGSLNRSKGDSGVSPVVDKSGETPKPMGQNPISGKSFFTPDNAKLAKTFGQRIDMGVEAVQNDMRQALIQARKMAEATVMEQDLKALALDRNIQQLKEETVALYNKVEALDFSNVLGNNGQDRAGDIGVDITLIDSVETATSVSTQARKMAEAIVMEHEPEAVALDENIQQMEEETFALCAKADTHFHYDSDDVGNISQDLVLDLIPSIEPVELATSVHSRARQMAEATVMEQESQAVALDQTIQQLEEETLALYANADAHYVSNDVKSIGQDLVVDLIHSVEPANLPTSVPSQARKMAEATVLEQEHKAVALDQNILQLEEETVALYVNTDAHYFANDVETIGQDLALDLIPSIEPVEVKTSAPTQARNTAKATVMEQEREAVALDQTIQQLEEEMFALYVNADAHYFANDVETIGQDLVLDLIPSIEPVESAPTQARKMAEAAVMEQERKTIALPGSNNIASTKEPIAIDQLTRRGDTSPKLVPTEKLVNVAVAPVPTDELKEVKNPIDSVNKDKSKYEIQAAKYALRYTCAKIRMDLNYLDLMDKWELRRKNKEYRDQRKEFRANEAKAKRFNIFATKSKVNPTKTAVSKAQEANPPNQPEKVLSYASMIGTNGNSKAAKAPNQPEEVLSYASMVGTNGNSKAAKAKRNQPEKVLSYANMIGFNGNNFEDDQNMDYAVEYDDYAYELEIRKKIIFNQMFPRSYFEEKENAMSTWGPSTPAQSSMAPSPKKDFNPYLNPDMTVTLVPRDFKKHNPVDSKNPIVVDSKKPIFIDFKKPSPVRPKKPILVDPIVANGKPMVDDKNPIVVNCNKPIFIDFKPVGPKKPILVDPIVANGKSMVAGKNPIVVDDSKKPIVVDSKKLIVVDDIDKNAILVDSKKPIVVDEEEKEKKSTFKKIIKGLGKIFKCFAPE